MNVFHDAMLKKIQKAELKVMAEGDRLARATAYHYTAVLNEGFEEVADGVLVAYLPFCIEPTQTAISRYCKWVAVCFHPTKYADFSTLHHVKFGDNGIHVNGFRKTKFRYPQLDKGQVKAMEAVCAHVNEKFRDGMVRNVHELVIKTQMQYGEFKPYSLPDGGEFPDSMDTPEVVSQVMVSLSEKLEAMV